MNYFTGKDSSRWRRQIPAAQSVGSGGNSAISYATFLGGAANDTSTALVTDSNGNLYMAGYTLSPDLPVTPNAVQKTLAPPGFAADAFVAKFAADGSLIYCTYLGGAGDDRALAIAADDGGNAYVTGYTKSPDFPVTSGAIVKTWNQSSSNTSAFVVKLNSQGDTLLYSTLLGSGGPGDTVSSIAITPDGSAVITGLNASPEFATTSGAAITRSPVAAFLAKLNPAGTGYQFVTALSTPSDVPYAVTVDVGGNAYITGSTLSVGPRGASGAGAPPAFQPESASRVLFRSPDRGASWTLPGPGLEGSTISDVVVDPSNSDVLYASGSAGVRRSTDGGQSWTPIFTFAVAFHTVIDPADGNHILVFAQPATRAVAVLFVSRDAGASWTPQGEVSFADAVFDPSDPSNVYAAAIDAPTYSRDGGDTWQGSLYIPATGFTKPVVDPFTPKTLYIGSSSGLFKSTDAGVTWQQSSFEGIRFLTADPRTNGVLYAISQSTLRVTSNGFDWKSIAPQLSVSNLFIDPTDPTGLFLFTTGGMLYSPDGGATVTSLASLPANTLVNKLVFDANRPGSWLAISNLAPDAFLEKFSADGASILFSTYFGGSASDSANRIALDSTGNVYIAGSTSSPDLTAAGATLPGPGIFHAFLAKFSTDGSQLGFSRYLGGSIGEGVSGMALDASGNAYVAGTTLSADFPVTADALPTPPPTVSAAKAYLTQMDSAGNIQFSTLLGGTQNAVTSGLAITPSGRVCISGNTNSPDLPVTGSAAQPKLGGLTDAFLMILDLSK